MPLTTTQRLNSITALAILMTSPVFAGPQDDGLWSQPFDFSWPIKNRNSLLMTPQGNILSIGIPSYLETNDIMFDVWNPELGTDESSHTTTNNTNLNISNFSSILMPESNKVLIASATNAGQEGPVIGNYIFDIQTNSISSAATSLAESQRVIRDHASTMVLPSGEILVAGIPAFRAPQPQTIEIYSPKNNQWRTLTNLIDRTVGYVDWASSAGEILTSSGILDPTYNGAFYSLDLSSLPSQENFRGLFSSSISPSNSFNTVMYRPDRFFTPGGTSNGGVSTVTAISTLTPYQRLTNNTRPYPVLASPKTIMLPTGNVMTISYLSPPGGESFPTQLEIWDAATESWSLMVNNNTLKTRDQMTLLRDGRILVISDSETRTFSPPYLFNSSGGRAERPTIISAPTKGSYSGLLPIKHGSGNEISRVTLVTAGRSNETKKSIGQRFIELDFEDTSDGVNVRLPLSRNTAPPGYYIMYLIDNKGVPSEGHMISIFTSVTPTATTDIVTTTGSEMITIDALANDNGLSLTLNAPNAWSLQGGNVALVNNKITYKPKVGFNGQDKIWYTFKDTQGRSNSGVIIITVSGNTSSNSPYPNASQDTITTTTSTATVIDVLANDIGVGLVLKAPNVWSLNGGRVSLQNNKLTYTSKTGFTGTDKIWYTFKDTQSRSNSGQVNITVTSGSSNTAFPVAWPDYYRTPKNTGKNLNILANDTGNGWKAIDTLYQYTAKGGTTYKTPEGQVWYTPKTGFTGEDNFWYVMIDSKGQKNSAQVKITVN